MKLGIIDYGAGNVRSVQFAFQRLGIEPTVTDVPETILSCDKLIFPGVGEASSAMKILKLKNLDQLIPSLKQDVLGICLGMQLMCLDTEEGNTTGFGIFNTSVKAFKSDLKVPHMGWNTVRGNHELLKDCSVDPDVYFVHSYYADLCDDTVMSTDYGITFSSALRKNNFYGFQFHPEKSGEWGAQLLKKFIEL